MTSNQSGSFCPKSYPMSSIAKPHRSILVFMSSAEARGVKAKGRSKAADAPASHLPSPFWILIDEFSLLDVGLFPRAHLAACFIEESLVVPLAQLLARFGRELREEGLVHVVDLQVFGLLGWRDLVGTEEEPVGVPVDQIGERLDRLGARDDVLRDLVPRDVDVEVVQLRIVQPLFDDLDLVRDRVDDAPQSTVRPDDGGV